jgi:hypothetical protein
MTQEAAQQIIEEAGKQQQITATLDARFTRCANKNAPGGGYRVRLAHRRAQRVLVIDKPKQWESVLQAWNDL